MSYQVLARKWRPRSFHEMVGQEHVLRALIHSLDRQRLHHAFLFSGTRGVGKTTIGRILARCLNCEQGISSRPCGQCSACHEIIDGRHVDLIEVDAASQTKVEQTRELLENAQYAPTRGRYKVYLIDEVHMLSRSSFNALLKTLEEPPDHVKFLLATTDPQKVPVTVLSRCLQFNLKNLSRELIGGRLQFVLDQEQVRYEEAALQRLARAAQGSMRDALSLADQAIAFGDGSVLDADVRSMLGDIEHDEIYRLLEALRNNDGVGLLDAVAEIAERGVDWRALLDELLQLLHRVAVLQILPANSEQRSQYDDREQEFAACIPGDELQLYYQIGLIGRRDLPLAPDPRSGLEMSLLRMLAFLPVTSEDELVSVRLAESGTDVVQAPAKKKTEQCAASLSGAAAESVVPPAAEAQEQTAPPDSDASKAVASATAEGLPGMLDGAGWIRLFPRLELAGVTRRFAEHLACTGQEGNLVRMQLDPAKGRLLQDGQRQEITAALVAVLGQPVRLELELVEPHIDTPASCAQRQRQARRAAAVAELEHEPLVQVLRQEFSAELELDSLRPITINEPTGDAAND